MAKTNSITKKPKKNISNEKHYIHLFEPNQKIDGFNFMSMEVFLKKFKKNSSNDIFIGDLLEYFPANETINVINELVAKLSINQKLYIQGIDAKSVSYSFATDQMDSTMFATLLYNNGTKKTTFTFPNMKYILSNINDLKITNIKFINSVNYYIECQKQ